MRFPKTVPISPVFRHCKIIGEFLRRVEWLLNCFFLFFFLSFSNLMFFQGRCDGKECPPVEKCCFPYYVVFIDLENVFTRLFYFEQYIIYIQTIEISDTFPRQAIYLRHTGFFGYHVLTSTYMVGNLDRL